LSWSIYRVFFVWAASAGFVAQALLFCFLLPLPCTCTWRDLSARSRGLSSVEAASRDPSQVRVVLYVCSACAALGLDFRHPHSSTGLRGPPSTGPSAFAGGRPVYLAGPRAKSGTAEVGLGTAVRHCMAGFVGRGPPFVMILASIMLLRGVCVGGSFGRAAPPPPRTELLDVEGRSRLWAFPFLRSDTPTARGDRYTRTYMGPTAGS
jgi:hypothetical protein